MNKQELIDKAVNALCGKLPDISNGCDGVGDFVVMRVPLSRNDESVGIFVDSKNDLKFIASGEEFEQRARELGYINGYRWGVEYLTNGKKPDLPDDVVVDVTPARNEPKKWTPDRVDNWIWDNSTCFEITDQRYKPQDTSHLDSVSEIPESKSNAENVSDWYDYEAQKAVALPPANVQVIGFIGTGFKEFLCQFIGRSSRGSLVVEKEGGEFSCYHSHQINFKPLDHATRKAEAEKHRVTGAALQAYVEIQSRTRNAVASFDELYDLGFLRMPAE